MSTSKSEFVFVDPEAVRGGDGSIEHPFTNLWQAFGATRRVQGHTLLLRPGAYQVPHVIAGGKVESSDQPTGK